MATSESVIRELLDTAGIKINGSQPWDLQVHDDRLYERVLRDSSLGLGKHIWRAGGIANRSTGSFAGSSRNTWMTRSKITSGWHSRWFGPKVFNRQSSARAYEVGQKHYDLGNDLYKAMLDKRLNYTCAYWKNASNLDEAQEAKLELVCKKIGIHSGMRILELGCGWGSFAKYAAEKYGASILGVTSPKNRWRWGWSCARACR